MGVTGDTLSLSDPFRLNTASFVPKKRKKKGVSTVAVFAEEAQSEALHASVESTGAKSKTANNLVQRRQV